MIRAYKFGPICLVPYGLPGPLAEQQHQPELGVDGFDVARAAHQVGLLHQLRAWGV